MAKPTRKEVHVFLTVLTAGVLFLYGVLYVLRVPGPQVADRIRGLATGNDQFKDSPTTPSATTETSPYLFMKKEREGIINRARKNGEDLLMRAKLFKLYRPTFSCPYKVAYFGKKDGKWVCGAEQLYSKSEDCVVYSFGVGGDSTFEADILKYTNCKVYAYDHTVKSIAYPLRPDNPRVTFGKYGLADYKSIGKPEFKTIKELMGINGHQWIDILKLDVEGAEFDGMTMLMDEIGELPVGQFQVELHVWVPKDQVYSKIVPWLNRLEEKGLRNFWSTPWTGDPAAVKIDCSKSSQLMAQCEYSFVNVNAGIFRNSTFTFEKLFVGAAMNTDTHYPDTLK